MSKLVLLRHGMSEWNKENRFTGWTDVDLAPEGVTEAKEAARLLKEGDYSFDAAYTSVLKRAIRTLWTVQDEMDLMWIPVTQHWRLNERHYGALQGLNKAETAKQHSDEQVKIWRRSYAVPPPPLKKSDPRHPKHDPRYADLTTKQLPATESLKDTVARFVPYYKNKILPALERGQRLIIVAHGNSLRALVKHLDGMSEQEIVEFNIPTAVPLVYEFNRKFQPLKRYYLGDAAKIAGAAAAVANQGKSA
jgi:2,3-bisphosphoglycerate-dependent phosphoglycerate mutase